MDDVLHFDIKQVTGNPTTQSRNLQLTWLEKIIILKRPLLCQQNAYLSALPYLLMWIVSVVSSVYADRLRAKGVSTGLVRKIFNTIG